MSRAWLWWGALALAACGSSGAPPPSPVPDLSAEAADANARLPPALRERLELAPYAVDRRWGRYAAVVPRGWERSFELLGETWTRCSDDPSSRGSCQGRATLGSLAIEATCDGTCRPRTVAQWAPVVDRVLREGSVARTVVASGEQVRQFSVERDEAMPSGRLRVATDPLFGTRFVTAVFVREGGTVFYACRARLDGELIAATDAFVHACRSLRPLEWGAPQTP